MKIAFFLSYFLNYKIPYHLVLGHFQAHLVVMLKAYVHTPFQYAWMYHNQPSDYPGEKTIHEQFLLRKSSTMPSEEHDVLSVSSIPVRLMGVLLSYRRESVTLHANNFSRQLKDGAFSHKFGPFNKRSRAYIESRDAPFGDIFQSSLMVILKNLVAQE